MNITATASHDAPTELLDPIPSEYRFIAPGTHHARVFFCLVPVATVVAILVSSQERLSAMLISICIGAGPFLALGFATRWLDAGHRKKLASIHGGAYLYFWLLTEEQSNAYRKTRHKKRRRLQMLCLLLPWVLGIVGAVVFGFVNIVGGSQVHRTLQGSAAIATVVTILFGGSFVFWWIWSVPRRAALNAKRLPIVFATKSILIADLDIAPWMWRRSREVWTIERDGRTWLSLDFRELRIQSRGSYVDKIVQEIPIPEGKEDDVPGIVRAYATT